MAQKIDEAPCRFLGLLDTFLPAAIVRLSTSGKSLDNFEIDLYTVNEYAVACVDMLYCEYGIGATILQGKNIHNKFFSDYGDLFYEHKTKRSVICLKPGFTEDDLRYKFTDKFPLELLRVSLDPRNLKTLGIENAPDLFKDKKRT